MGGLIFNIETTGQFPKDVDTMLTNSPKEHFKNILHQRLDTLLLRVNDTIKGATEPKDTSPEIVDQAYMEGEADYSFHIIERESKLIVKIKEALERLEEGTFGICEECGNEISEKRLEARPVAIRCIDCKRKQEIEEKKRGL